MQIGVLSEQETAARKLLFNLFSEERDWAGVSGLNPATPPLDLSPQGWKIVVCNPQTQEYRSTNMH